jgi:hypothetical protein
MLAMAVFYWAYPAIFERRQSLWAAIAGLAIGFAFLCRPLTAVGLGFPYAAYSLYRWSKQPPIGYGRRLAVLVASFSVCALGLAWFSYSVLGNPFDTPYSRYTATVTPSHVYGFYNRQRGLAHRGPDTFTAYDDWASDLTPSEAAPIAFARLEALLLQGLGGLPTFAALLALALFSLRRSDDRVLLHWLAIAGLSLAYTPYWFEGLFGYGYIAESFPVVAILVAHAASSTARSLLGVSWSFLLLGRCLLNAVVVAPLLFHPNGELVFPRIAKQQIVLEENQRLQADRAPLLVLVQADPKNAVHTTLVNNHPRLDAPVVRGWYKEEYVDRLLQRYPERAVYVLHYDNMTAPHLWTRLRGPVVRRQ